MHDLPNVALCPCCKQPFDPAEIVFSEDWRIVAHHGERVALTPRETQVFARLHRAYPNLVHRDVLHAALYAGDRDGGADPKILDIFVCKLRKKLSPLGIVIETVWAAGYRLTVADPADADAIKAAGFRERAAGGVFHWTDGHDRALQALWDSGQHNLIILATRLDAPFKATARAIKRLRLSQEKERLHA